ncbi:membrane protein [Pandoraea pneumonica]|jgi:drug/metabolite transporter (DMT)-like permease|uniref:Membrane protein n=1 Tax=Pandoraea pneumonica TaxID=2508299 RepID=A0A5E4V8W9_9BURK|nr:DMT family transporter [Pandoraea pneumonica]VVE08732.1 membrane protein [Pandoraea pneumonica]
MFNFILPLTAVLIWSANVIVNKLAVGHIFPAEIAFLRWFAAGVILTPFALPSLWRQRKAFLPHLAQYATLGVLGMAIYQGLAYSAAHYTSATNMGIILSLLPLTTLTLAVVVLGDVLTAGAIAGGLLSIFGVLLVVGHGSVMHLADQGIGIGDAMMVFAMLAYAIYCVLLRKWRLPLAPLPSLYAQIVCAVIALLPFYLMSQKAGVSMDNLPELAFATIPVSIAAPFIWMIGVARIGPRRATVVINLVPIFTALIAAFGLGEHLAAYHLLGGALILAGVALGECWHLPIRKARELTQKLQEDLGSVR